ncbi:MAG: hypothetical protein ABSF83_11960, partial [Nitrososphaerales archaeon]
GRFSLVVGTDILGLGQARRAMGRADVVLADRATCFRDREFDVVAFNPPYLPSEEIRDRTVDGGRGGIEVPERFLEDALRVVKASGRIYVLLSDRGDLAAFLARCLDLGTAVRETARARLFYETLVVYEVRRPS